MAEINWMPDSINMFIIQALHPRFRGHHGRGNRKIAKSWKTRTSSMRLLKEKKKRWYGVKDLKGSGITKLWKVGEIRDERVKNDHDTL